MDKTVIPEEKAELYGILDILIAMSEQMDKRELLARIQIRDEELERVEGGVKVQEVLEPMITYLAAGL